MLLKIFLILVAASAGITILLRQPRAKRAGWFVTGMLVLLGLLVVQIMRTLDTMWR